MKTFLKIFGAIGALVVIAIAALFLLTAGMRGTADDFFAAVKANNYQAANTHLSDDFKSSTNEMQLKQFIANNGLNEFQKFSWRSGSYSDGLATLSGSIATVAGGTIPISVQFVNGNNGWKIFSISKPLSGVVENVQTGILPSEQEQLQLANDAMTVFAISTFEKSMAKMYNYSSNLWQQQTSVAALDESFGAFFPFEDDMLRVLEQNAPQFFENATITNDGILVLRGLYPTEPKKVYFEQQYINEGAAWKLIGLNVIVE